MDIIDKIKDIKNLKFVRNSSSGNVYFGELDGKDLIIISKSSNPKIDVFINNINKFNKIFDNRRYYKFDGFIPYQSDISVIYPAQDIDINKYKRKEIIKLLETPKMYFNETYPKIKDQNLEWIHNILTKKHESDNIIYEDKDFVLLPDMKWDGKDMETIYCLAIVKDGSIRSIRDLESKHIPLLEGLYENGLNVIEKKYGVNRNRFRAYFHYRPSFWHLHVHFNLVKNVFGGCTVDCSHSLLSVINNVKLCSDYYKKAILEVNIHE